MFAISQIANEEGTHTRLCLDPTNAREEKKKNNKKQQPGDDIREFWTGDFNYLEN